MTASAAPPSMGRTLVMTLVMAGLLIGLGLAQLAWLGRSDRVNDLLASMIGPFVGILFGAWLGRRLNPGKPVRRHSSGWIVMLGAVLMVGWLAVVALLNGGLDGGAIVPTVVLGAFGAGCMLGCVQLIAPEQIA